MNNGYFLQISSILKECFKQKDLNVISISKSLVIFNNNDFSFCSNSKLLMQKNKLVNAFTFSSFACDYNSYSFSTSLLMTKIFSVKFPSLYSLSLCCYII